MKNLISYMKRTVASLSMVFGIFLSQAVATTTVSTLSTATVTVSAITLGNLQEASAQRKFLRKNGYNPTALGSLMKTKDNKRQIQEIGIGSDRSFKVAYKKARHDLNSNLAVKLKNRAQATQTEEIESQEENGTRGMNPAETRDDFKASSLVEADALLSRVEIVDNIQGLDKKTGMWMVYLKGELRFKNSETGVELDNKAVAENSDDN